MLITRKGRARVLPTVSVAVALLMTLGIVHGVAVKGEPAGPLLGWVGVPVLVFLAYAGFALRRIERRGDQILWGRLGLGPGHDARRCALRGVAHQGGRGSHVTVELLVHGEAKLDVITLNDDGNADATGQRIAEALQLTYTPVARSEAPSAS